jgi:hypothetical protein
MTGFGVKKADTLYLRDTFFGGGDNNESTSYLVPEY